MRPARRLSKRIKYEVDRLDPCAHDTQQRYDRDHADTQIFVRTLTGRTITLDVKLSDTIAYVKEQIQAREGVLPSDQRLTWSFKVLSVGTRTLRNYNIPPYATITLLAKLRGGSMGLTRTFTNKSMYRMIADMHESEHDPAPKDMDVNSAADESDESVGSTTSVRTVDVDMREFKEVSEQPEPLVAPPIVPVVDIELQGGVRDSEPRVPLPPVVNIVIRGGVLRKGQKEEFDTTCAALAERYGPRALVRGVDYDRTWIGDSLGICRNLPPLDNDFYPFFGKLDVAGVCIVCSSVYTKRQIEFERVFIQQPYVSGIKCGREHCDHCDDMDRAREKKKKKEEKYSEEEGEEKKEEMNITIPVLKSFNVLKEAALKLPLIELYLKDYTETKEDDTEVVHTFGFCDFFDLLKRILQFGDNLSQMTFVPEVGDFVNQFWHGDYWSKHPLFTFPYLYDAHGQRWWLGGYVRYTVEGTDYIGRITNIFTEEDTNVFLRGLYETRKRSAEEVLNAACDRAPPLSCRIRRYSPVGGNQDDELIAMWGVEDKLPQAAGIKYSVRVETTQEGFQKAKAEEQALDEGIQVPVYLCLSANVDAVIGAQQGGDPVPIGKMPHHPMDSNQQSYKELFELLDALPPGLPVLRLFLAFYFDGMKHTHNTHTYTLSSLSHCGCGCASWFLT